MVPIRRFHRNLRQPEKLRNVQIVCFKRNRNSKNIKLSYRCFRFQGEQRRAGPFEFLFDVRIRNEDSLAPDSGIRIEKLVDRLEPEIGHSYVIGVRVSERDVEAATPWLSTH